MSVVQEFFTVLSAFIKLKSPVPEFTEAPYSKNLEKLLMISQGMTHYTDLDQVLGYLLASIQESFEIDCGILMLENERVYKVRCHKGFPAAFVSGMALPLGEGALGKAASAGSGLVLSQEQFCADLGLEDVIQSAGWQCFLMTPIMLQSQNLGLFIACARQENFFTEPQIEILKPYLQVLSVGMRNVELIEMMEKFNRRLTAEVSSTTQELTQTNDRLIRRVRELKALYEITLSASIQTNLEEILESVSPKIADFFNVEHVGFLVNTSPKGRRADFLIQGRRRT
jgi:transcriptional regulator with GAF, ATPase, and Fis domain